MSVLFKYKKISFIDNESGEEITEDHSFYEKCFNRLTEMVTDVEPLERDIERAEENGVEYTETFFSEDGIVMGADAYDSRWEMVLASHLAKELESGVEQAVIVIGDEDTIKLTAKVLVDTTNFEYIS